MAGDQNMGKKQQSNFSVTCNLLSQFLKEKGGAALGSLDHPQFIHGVNKKPTTMDLFPHGFDEDRSSKASNIEKLAPLTIFYGGKVLVFEDFPAEKAKDLMQMAGGKEAAAAVAAASSSLMITAAASGSQQPAENGLVVKSSTNGATASDMPIARRNSLQRFLEKRKDRVTARAPYFVGSGDGGGGSAVPEMEKTMQKDGRKSWLGLGREIYNPEESLESRR